MPKIIKRKVVGWLSSIIKTFPNITDLLLNLQYKRYFFCNPFRVKMQFGNF